MAVGAAGRYNAAHIACNDLPRSLSCQIVFRAVASCKPPRWPARPVSPRLSFAEDKKPSANERLAIGVIGVAGQGEHDWKQIVAGGAEVIAWCDVDESRTKTAREAFPTATFYTDFRRLIDQKGLDAVLVATPDHTHAVATLAACGPACTSFARNR